MLSGQCGGQCGGGDAACHSMVLAHVGAGGEAQLAALLAAWLLWFGGLRLGESLQARALLTVVQKHAACVHQLLLPVCVVDGTHVDVVHRNHLGLCALDKLGRCIYYYTVR